MLERDLVDEAARSRGGRARRDFPGGWALGSVPLRKAAVVLRLRLGTSTPPRLPGLRQRGPLSAPTFSTREAAVPTLRAGLRPRAAARAGGPTARTPAPASSVAVCSVYGVLSWAPAAAKPAAGPGAPSVYPHVVPGRAARWGRGAEACRSISCAHVAGLRRPDCWSHVIWGVSARAVWDQVAIWQVDSE